MDRKEIADRISKVIADNPFNGKPLSSYQLAQRGIINSKTLSNILNLKVRPNPATLIKFAEFYNTSVEWLMTGKEQDLSKDEHPSNVYLEIIQKLSRSLELRDSEIERLHKIIERITNGTCASCSRDEKCITDSTGTDSGHKTS